MDREQLISSYDRYQSSWVNGDWKAWQATLHAQYSFTLAGADIGGISATTVWSVELLAAFPDYSHEVLRRYADAAAGEGTVVIEAVAMGTANGRRPSALLPPPEAGRRFRLPYVKVLGFREGLIREDRQYHDVGSLVAQLYPERTLDPRR